MSRNLTTTSPSTTYPYLIQTDVETTTGGILTASLQTGLGVSVAQLNVQATSAVSASYANNVNIDNLTGSLVTTSSLNTFTASYKIDSASFSASIADLYTGSGGGGTSTDTLQDVTTRGNYTSTSIDINNDLRVYQNLKTVSGTAINSSVAFGQDTQATGQFSFAHGNGAVFISPGFDLVASGQYSHAEGEGTKAIGLGSHAEGLFTTAIGQHSHAEGHYTTAGTDSINNTHLGCHAEGEGTIAAASFQHAQGMWNIPMSGAGAFIVGNGTNNTLRSNLIYAQGSEVQITGSLLIGGINVSASIADLYTGSGGGGTPTDVSTYLSSSWTASYQIDSASFSASIATLNNFTGSVVAVSASYSLSASFATSASYVLSSSYATNSSQSLTSLTASFAISASRAVSSSFSSTASFVSGAILNTPDPYTSTVPVFRIVTLTAAEYSAIVTKDANTFYAVI